MREEFEKNFVSRGEVGASICIKIGEDTVVDLSGGSVDEDGNIPWTPETLSVVFSNTKGATALCAHYLVDQGELQLDDPVSKYWPEYAVNGKENTSVAMMLNHSAGVPALRDPVIPGGVTDWDYMVKRLEAETPFWEPGTRHGYHAVTFGWTVGELVRRVSGESLGTFFRNQITGPLGLDFWIGLPNELETRVAPYIPVTELPAIPNAFQLAFQDSSSLSSLAALNTGGYTILDEAGNRGMDTPEVHRAEIGAVGGIASARALAGMYQPLANGGGSLLSRDTVLRMGQTSTAVICDPVLKMQTHFGYGFMKTTDNRSSRDGNDGMIIGERAFGHPGAGGSLGFADPDCHMSFGYIMNRMGANVLLNPRGQSLVDAAYRCLGYRTNNPGAWVK